MILPFNADEILELAIAMERHGARFYHAAMKYTGDQSAQNLLEELASWEEKHEAIFAGMQQALRDERPALNVFDPDGEEAKYLSALTDDRVFPKDDPTDRLTGEGDATRVHHLAGAAQGERRRRGGACRMTARPPVGRGRMAPGRI